MFLLQKITSLVAGKAAEKGQNDREIAAEKGIDYISKGDWLQFKNLNKKYADIYDKPIKKLG